MYKFLNFLGIGLLCFSCRNQPKVVDSKTGAQFFGDSISTDGSVTMADMLTKMGDLDSMDCKVVATPVAVCQNKGCWMQVTTAGIKDTMMVNFKDYGFFMPKDIAGKKVVMQGFAYKELTSVDDLKHYAEDAHKSKAEIDAIKEPKSELKFMASGVIVTEK